jgi:hypothetical protein
LLENACRAFEQELLDAAGGSDEKQLELLRGLWHRQLQLPQSSAAELLAEYEAWEASSGKVRHSCRICMFVLKYICAELV